MRKIASSAKTRCNVALSVCAEARSRPKGFSTTTRAPSLPPERPSSSTTAGKALGGVALHVVKQLGELGESARMGALLREGLPYIVAKAVRSQGLSRNRDDRNVEMAVLDHRQQRGIDLLAGKIAGAAEEHQRIGRGGGLRPGVRVSQRKHEL